MSLSRGPAIAGKSAMLSSLLLFSVLSANSALRKTVSFHSNSSALSHPSSSRTQSPPHTRHPHDESRPSPDRSLTLAQSAPPSPSFRPPPSPAPNVANTQSPLRRHYESIPTKPRSPYSPAHSTAANPQSHPTRPASIPSRDRATPRCRSPSDLAQSQSALSIHRAPPNHSAPIRTCPVLHNPASKSAKAIPETSHASAPK